MSGELSKQQASDLINAASRSKLIAKEVLDRFAQQAIADDKSIGIASTNRVEDENDNENKNNKSHKMSPYQVSQQPLIYVKPGDNNIVTMPTSELKTFAVTSEDGHPQLEDKTTQELINRHMKEAETADIAMALVTDKPECAAQLALAIRMQQDFYTYLRASNKDDIDNSANAIAKFIGDLKQQKFPYEFSKENTAKQVQSAIDLAILLTCNLWQAKAEATQRAESNSELNNLGATSSDVVIDDGNDDNNEAADQASQSSDSSTASASSASASHGRDSVIVVTPATDPADMENNDNDNNNEDADRASQSSDSSTASASSASVHASNSSDSAAVDAAAANDAHQDITSQDYQKRMRYLQSIYDHLYVRFVTPAPATLGNDATQPEAPEHAENNAKQYQLLKTAGEASIPGQPKQIVLFDTNMPIEKLPSEHDKQKPEEDKPKTLNLAWRNLLAPNNMTVFLYKSNSDSEHDTTPNKTNDSFVTSYQVTFPDTNTMCVSSSAPSATNNQPLDSKTVKLNELLEALEFFGVDAEASNKPQIWSYTDTPITLAAAMSQPVTQSSESLLRNSSDSDENDNGHEQNTSKSNAKRHFKCLSKIKLEAVLLHDFAGLHYARIQKKNFNDSKLENIDTCMRNLQNFIGKTVSDSLQSDQAALYTIESKLKDALGQRRIIGFFASTGEDSYRVDLPQLFEQKFGVSRKQIHTTSSTVVDATRAKSSDGGVEYSYMLT